MKNLLDRTHELIEKDGYLLSLFAGAGRFISHPPITKAVIEGDAVVPQIARVSVIIPCFNYGRFLPAAVESALSQDGLDIEVIIVDDASTDDSAEVAEALAQQNPGIVLLRNTQNSGHVITFNNGYKAASGDFIVRLDADDLLTPGSLTRAIALFEEFPEVGLVYGRPRHFTTVEPPQPRLGATTWTVWSGTDWIAERCKLGVNCITTPEAMIRASVMREVGGLSTELKFAQDMEMWLRVAAISDVGWIGGCDQALHRDHEGSMSDTAGSDLMVDLNERRTVFKVLFDRMGPDIPNAAELRDVAMRTLAGEALGWARHAYDRGRVSIAPVDQLVDFAAQTWPGYRSLRQYGALQRRRRVGARSSRYTPPFLATLLARRIGAECAYARWVQMGI